MKHRTVKVKTLSGRIIDFPCYLRTEGIRKYENDLKRCERWLINEAIKEAEYKKDKWCMFHFKAINPKNLSQSDMDGVCLYLFGDISVKIKEIEVKE